MPTTLDAGYVYTSDDGDTLLVGFADRQYDTQRFVLLQRARAPLISDRSLGHADVHLTVDGQEGSVYGAIQRIELRESSIKLELTSQGAREVGKEAPVVVRFTITDEEREELTHVLREMFSDQPQLLTVHSAE